MAEMPNLVGDVTIHWHHEPGYADPKDVPMDAVMVEDQCGQNEQPSAEKVGWKTPGVETTQGARTVDSLREFSQADRWRLRIANRATVIIEERPSHVPSRSRYSLDVEVEREDGRIEQHSFADESCTYDDAYLAGVETARELVAGYAIIDSAERLLMQTLGRCEGKLRQSWADRG